MPKEIAHFTMARMTGAALGRAHSPFRKALGKYPNLFVLGGVAPDIAFYCLAGPGARETQALSAPFHRPDKRALLPVLEFLDRRRARGKEDLPALALAAGAVCHIMADTVFHPMVYYFAGMDGAHPGATARHRQFETAMDLCFWQDDPGDHWLGNRVASLEISRQDLSALLADLFRARDPGQVCRALGWYKWIQYLFFAPWMKRILTGFKQVGRPLPATATGLAYPFRGGVDLPFFAGEIVFYDPCTGVRNKARIMDMARDVVGSVLKVLALAAEGIGRQESLAEYLMAHPGLPRIRPGLPKEGFRLWREEEDIMPRIYRGYPPPF